MGTGVLCKYVSVMLVLTMILTSSAYFDAPSVSAYKPKPSVPDFMNAHGRHPICETGAQTIIVGTPLSATLSQPSLTSNKCFDVDLQLMDQSTLIFIAVFTAMAIGAGLGFLIDAKRRKRKRSWKNDANGSKEDTHLLNLLPKYLEDYPFTIVPFQ